MEGSAIISIQYGKLAVSEAAGVADCASEVIASDAQRRKISNNLFIIIII